MMVYTDGKDELFAAVSKSRLALNASDLVTDRKQQIAQSNAGRLRQQVDRLRLSAARFAATQWQRLQDHFRQHQREPGMAK